LTRGRVIDASTERGLPFANILVENTNYRASTDVNGDFKFHLPPKGSRLVVSYVGYRTDSIRAGADDSPVTVRLTPVGYTTEEVDVVATIASGQMPDALRLGSAEIKNFAGITRDPMRALQQMPGVSTNDEASAKMDVRGGTWDENSVVIDGAEIYAPYHLKEVTLSSIGIFNMDMVKGIDFSSGGFGAEYGDALSSVTSVHFKEGNRERFEGNVNLSPLDLSACVQGPIDKNSSFIIAARGSYLGYMLKTLNVSQDIYAGYYDIQGDLGYDLGSYSKLKVDFIYSKDNAVQAPSDVSGTYAYQGSLLGSPTLISRSANLYQSFDGNYGTSLLSARLTSVLSGKLTGQTLVYYSTDMEHEELIMINDIGLKFDRFPDMWTAQSTGANETYDLDIRSLSVNQHFDYKVSPSIDLQAGASVRRISYDYLPNMSGQTVVKTNTQMFPDTTVSASPGSFPFHDTTAIMAQTFALGGYIEQEFRIGDKLTLNMGARLDYFDMDKEMKYSPRLNLTYAMPLGIGMTAEYGIYYQLPTYEQLRSSEPSAANTPFQEATHLVLGFEKKFGDAVDAGIQIYRKNYSELVPTARMLSGRTYYYTDGTSAEGYANGVDLRCSATLSGVEFSFGYGFLVAMERITGSGGPYYPRTSDQRHTASMAIIFNLGAGWTGDIRGFYGSGYAYTPEIARIDSTTMIGTWTQGSENSAHYPPYERLDARITRTFTLMGSPLRFYIDVTNVFNRKNVWSYQYTYDSSGNTKLEPMRLLGIVPAVGINYTFGF
jgi:CarboxypepD_reg-like domain/TonB-dependent Receptor Plug Domain